MFPVCNLATKPEPPQYRLPEPMKYLRTARQSLHIFSVLTVNDEAQTKSGYTFLFFFPPKILGQISLACSQVAEEQPPLAEWTSQK